MFFITRPTCVIFITIILSAIAGCFLMPSHIGGGGEIR